MARSGESARARRTRARLAIGVMIDNVDDGYQQALWSGLEQGGRDAGADVLHFLGGHLDPDQPAFRHRNGIFELIGPECLDGLIVVSSVMSSHIGNERLVEWCQRFRPLPLVSLGFELPGLPSVVCERRRGLHELLAHLIDHHGRRRIAFVAGTVNNEDSALREVAFRETLAEKQTPFDPRLLLRADFTPEKASSLVERLVEDGVPFDAVACVNDETAIAVLEALERRGVRVPEDVSVTGYDDITAAARQTLPLTTVRQPLQETARRAIDLLVGMIQGEPPPELECHPAQLVIRRSCGCLTEVVRSAGDGTPRAAAAPDLRGAVAAALAGGAGTAVGRAGPCLEELVRALEADVRGDAPAGTFVARLDTCLRTGASANLGDDAWEEIVSALRREAHGRLGPSQAVEARLHQARVLVGESGRQRRWKAYSQLARKTQTVQYVIENLIGSFDIPTLLDNMARELPRIGIRRCYLAVHASTERAYQDALLLLAYDEHGRRDVGEGIPYPARQLLPEGIAVEERHSLLWQPLIFGEEEVGFIGLDYNPPEDISSLALAQQIRSALKASMMMQELQEKDRLLLTVDRMRNEFVANVTHDFRSLVTIIMDSSWLATQPDDRRGAPELRELAGIAYEASLRLKVAIDRLLDLASMDEHGLVLRVRKFRSRRFLAELAAFYRPVLSVSGIELTEELPAAEIEDLYTDPDKVEQIMHNLISNAAKVVTPGQGRIRLSLTARPGAVEIAVTDDGEGIPADRLETIFVRYHAQKRPTRRGGSGIGLAFVKELAAYLRGSIAAHSEGPGKGACFTLTLVRGKDVFSPAEMVGETESGARETAVVRQQARQLLESSLRGRVAQKTKPASA
jgi:DNA-binding LacI/PurR family transcriptional regulator/signal transduction histidine kinase